MIALDTSVVVPALLTWHEHHDRCQDAAVDAHVPAHVVLEAYSVMTRLPAPHRISSQDAWQVLGSRFSHDDVLPASDDLQRRVVTMVSAVGVDGGATYDAVIGLTAAEHGATLLSRDVRASRIYEVLGVDHRLLHLG